MRTTNVFLILTVECH